ELWDHPEFADLSLDPDGAHVRDMIHRADRLSLAEARRIFTNSANVRQRLERSTGLAGEVLYHRSPMVSLLLERDEAEPEDFVLYPGRIDKLKRQHLLVEAMRHVDTDVRAVFVGGGPMVDELRKQIADARLDRRVEIRTGLSDEELAELYLRAL